MSDRELDALVAEKVMGYTNVRPLGDEHGTLIAHSPGACCDGHGVPQFSTDIAAAWHVVEKMRERRIHLELGSRIDGSWLVSFGNLRAFDNSAPRAVCLAALKAVGVEVPS